MLKLDGLFETGSPVLDGDGCSEVLALRNDVRIIGTEALDGELVDDVCTVGAQFAVRSYNVDRVVGALSAPVAAYDKTSRLAGSIAIGEECVGSRVG